MKLYYTVKEIKAEENCYNRVSMRRDLLALHAEVTRLQGFLFQACGDTGASEHLDPEQCASQILAHQAKLETEVERLKSESIDYEDQLTELHAEVTQQAESILKLSGEVTIGMAARGKLQAEVTRLQDELAPLWVDHNRLTEAVGVVVNGWNPLWDTAAWRAEFGDAMENLRLAAKIEPPPQDETHDPDPDGEVARLKEMLLDQTQYGGQLQKEARTLDDRITTQAAEIRELMKESKRLTVLREKADNDATKLRNLFIAVDQFFGEWDACDWGLEPANPKIESLDCVLENLRAVAKIKSPPQDETLTPQPCSNCGTTEKVEPDGNGEWWCGRCNIGFDSDPDKVGYLDTPPQDGRAETQKGTG